jgi:6-phosphogluconolactonase
VTVQLFPSADSLAAGVADFISNSARKSIAARGQFNIALSGGSTPLAGYRLLTGSPARDSIEWAKVHIFWSDERCVNPEDKESNYGAAKLAFLDAVPLPSGNIHRIHGELDPAHAAEQYRLELATHFKTRGIPVFDLIVLGLGEDGHTASLFPRSQALIRGEVPVAENYVTHLESWRVTFTFPLINSARQVAFIVSGEDKAEVVKEIIEGGEKQFPAKAVQPQSGELIWLLDEAAAALLTR